MKRFAAERAGNCVKSWEEHRMLIEMDFQSDEALYIQLRNQIVLGVAGCLLREGDSLPPVRQMAEQLGINMHTVNKAYALLREEGFLTIDRRKGAVVAVEVDKIRAAQELREQLRPVLAKALCRGMDTPDIHEIVDELCEQWMVRKDNK